MTGDITPAMIGCLPELECGVALLYATEDPVPDPQDAS
jgi:hypothetical protein